MSLVGEDVTPMDCARMGMAAPNGDVDFDDPCCDSKSKCPDTAACLMKCGTHVIGIVMPAIKLAATVDRQFLRAEPREPPDWSDQPQPPPPRT